MRSLTLVITLLTAAGAGAQQFPPTTPPPSKAPAPPMAAIAAEDAWNVAAKANGMATTPKPAWGAFDLKGPPSPDAAFAKPFGSGFEKGDVPAIADEKFIYFNDAARRELPYVPLAKFPAARTQSVLDAADSLYRLGQSALTDGEFRKAADLFSSLATRYPDSDFAPDALYYRAYALYKIGTSRELQLAVDALDRQATRYPKARTLADGKQLRATIISEQAKRGDAGAAQTIAEAAKVLRTENKCSDDDEMRMTAITALRNDPDVLIPTLQKILARTDECSIRLRRSAVNLIAQTKEEERSDILLRVASSDPSVEVRREAVQWLAEVNTERAAKALDSILFTTKDAEIRDRALSALSRHRNPMARESLKRFAEQTNVSTELRARAINYIGSGRRTGDEPQYLQGLFNKTASPELRLAIIEAFTNLKTPDRVQWLLNVARDRKQEIEVRKRALYSASQNGVELKDLFAMYDEMRDQPEMQDQLLYVYAQRREPEATDRLIEIARTEKNADLRRKALFWLGNKSKDPKVKQFLLDFIAQP